MSPPHLQRNATIPPLLLLSHSPPHMQRPMTPCLAHTCSPTQLATLSRKDMLDGRGGHRDRGGSRLRNRGRVRPRSSRSRSPGDPAKPRFRRHSAEKEAIALSACPTCLSRRQRPIQKCQAPNLWNGQRKARCTRTEDGRIVDGDGRTLCTNWNQTIGCKDQRSKHIHECSGCGERTHGAHDCPLAEKAQSADTSHR